MRLGQDGPAVLATAPYRPVRCLCGNDCFGLRGATPQSHAVVVLTDGQTWVVPRAWLFEGPSSSVAPPAPRPRWEDRPENALIWGLACWANAAAAKVPR